MWIGKKKLIEKVKSQALQIDELIKQINVLILQNDEIKGQAEELKRLVEEFKSQHTIQEKLNEKLLAQIESLVRRK